MKALYVIPPVLALLVSGVWLGRQHVEYTELETKTRVLEERIVQYESLPMEVLNGGATAIAGAGKKSDPFLNDDGTLNWLEIGRMVKESEKGGGMQSNFKMYIRLQERMMSLKLEEIRSALELVKSEEEFSEVREQIEVMLVGLLLQSEPEEALTMLKDELRQPHGQLSWQVQNAFGTWLKDDPVGAVAWFDARRAEGAFDSKALDPGKSLAKELEVRVLMSFAESDPAAMEERLSLLSKAELKAALGNAHLWGAKTESLSQYTDLARENFEDEEKNQMIGSAFASVIHHGGLDEVTKRMEGIDLSAEERTQVFEQVRGEYASPWSRKSSEIAEFHAWIQREEPEQAAELTGKTFADYAQYRNADFAELFQEVIRLSEAQNDPEILQGFTSSLRDAEGHGNSLEDEELKGRFQELMKRMENTSNE